MALAAVKDSSMKSGHLLDVFPFQGFEKMLLSSHACVVKIAKTWHPWPKKQKIGAYRGSYKRDAITYAFIATLNLHYKLCFKYEVY